MFNTQAKYFEERLESAWGDITPIIEPNVNKIPKRGTSWIRFLMTWTDSALIAGTVADGTYRERGLGIINVFTPRGSSVAANNEYCAQLHQIFLHWERSGFKCNVPYTVRVGKETEWFHQNVYVPFEFDHRFKV